jgi:hypothetical protein
MRTVSSPLRLDLRSLALLRIGMGLTVLADLLWRLKDLREFYTDEGALPRLNLIRDVHSTYFNVHLSAGSMPGVLTILLVQALCACALVLGYRTRLAAIATWYLVVSLQNRNPFILDGGDDELRMILFWLPFLPVAAKWSLDARQGRASDSGTSVASFGYILQIFCVYFFAALFKSDPIWTKDGNGLYYALCYQQFTTRIGNWALHYPTLLRFLSFGSLFFERFAPWLLVSPVGVPVCRIVFLLGLWSFHGGILIMMALGLFPITAMVASLGLIPGCAWDLAARKWPRFKSGDTPIRKNPGSIARKLLVLAQLAICVQILAWNWLFLHQEPYPAPITWIAYFSREIQSMNFFSPHPPMEAGFFIVDTTLADGNHIDLCREGAPLRDWLPPYPMREAYRDYRVRRWYQTMQEKPWLVQPFLIYLVKNWNEQHAASRQVTHIRLCYLFKLSPFPGLPWPETHMNVLGEYSSASQRVL